MYRNTSRQVLNDVLVKLFNRILAIEENALAHACSPQLTITEVHVLEAVGRGEPRSMSEIAALLSVTLGTLTTAVSRLVKKGYVSRLRPDEDRRLVLVQLTEAGRRPYVIHERFHREMVGTILQGLEPEEEQTLIVSLQKLYTFFARFDGRTLCEEDSESAQEEKM